jgi:transcriptional accessory protein Tex/SPT6
MGRRVVVEDEDEDEDDNGAAAVPTTSDGPAAAEEADDPMEEEGAGGDDAEDEPDAAAPADADDGEADDAPPPALPEDDFDGLPSDEEEAADSGAESGEDSDDDNEGEEGGDDDDDNEGEEGAAKSRDDEDEDEVVVSKKAKKRKAAVDDELDDDDLALLEENTGMDVSRLRKGEGGRRRLQKKAREETAPVATTAEDAENEIAAGLFGDDDDEAAEAAEGDDEDEPKAARPARDAEIDDDDESDEKSDGFIEYAPGERPVRRKHALGVSEELANMREEAEDIFGTSTEIRELLAFTRGDASTAVDEGDDEEEADAQSEDESEDEEMDGFIDDDEDEDDEETRAKKEERRARRERKYARKGKKRLAAGTAEEVIDKLYSEEDRKAFFKTSEDAELRDKDLPERLQLAFRNRDAPHPRELEMEALFIFSRLFAQGVGKLPEDADGAPPVRTEEENELRTKRVLRAIETVLSKLREGEPLEGTKAKGKKKGGSADEEEGVEEDAEGEADEDEASKERRRFELAFIAYYRKEDWAAVLTPAQLHAIPELDREHYHLQSSKAALLRSATARFAHEPDLLKRLRALLRTADSLHEVLDLEAWLENEYDVKNSGAAAEDLDPRAAVGGARRPAKNRSLYAAACKGSASVLAEKFGLSVRALAENVVVHFGQQNLPADELLTPEEVAKDFIDMMAAQAASGSAPPLPAELQKPEGALAAAREVFAHGIASNIDLRHKARSHMGMAARLQVEATPKGADEVDPTHALYRVMNELHVRPKDTSAAARERRNSTTLYKLLPGAPYRVDWHNTGSREEAVAKAELLMMAAKAQQLGLITMSVEVPQLDDYPDAPPDPFLVQLQNAFLTPVDETDPNPCADKWNAQRTLILRRATLGLLYPKLGKEALETALREAQLMVAAECAQRLHALAYGPPFRIAPAERKQQKPGKKKKPDWLPNVGDYYERKARVVGATLLPSDDMGRANKGARPGLKLVAIDENGTMLSHFQCTWLLTNIRTRGPTRDQQGNSIAQMTSCSQLDVERKMSELERLENWLVDAGCEAIALGAVDLVCRRLVEELNHVAFAIALRREGEKDGDEMARDYYRASRPHADHPMDKYPNISREAFANKLPFKAMLVDEAIPARWAATVAAQSELPELDTALRTALSSARMLQDPFAELCHVTAPTALKLSNLPLHPMASQLPEDILERGLVNELVDCACRLGVHVDDVQRQAHRMHVLQFVPGLGPRKAGALLRDLQSRSANSLPIQSRQELLDEKLLGPVVWHNAAGFLIFDTARQIERWRPPGLEGCRIHPEEYEHAKRICFDGIYDENEEPEENPQTMNEAVDRAMGREAYRIDEQTGQESLCLDSLELDEFAQHLKESEGARTGVETLTDIRSELAHPFRDMRGAVEGRGPVDTKKLFELLTGETDETLRPELLTSATVTRYEAGRQFQEQHSSGKLHCQLQCGLSLTIDEDKISDQFTRVPTDAHSRPQLSIKEGQIISVKVLAVHRDTFQVDGACRGQDLSSALHQTLAEQERHAAEEKKRQERARTPQYVRRRIAHPLFKQGTHDQVAELLKVAPVGEVYFRPSSKGTAHLTASIKLSATGPLLHVDIAEEDKPSAAELGASLFLGRDESKKQPGERFDDLDEIIARYIEPLVENVRELEGHRKFVDEKGADVLERMLKAEKSGAPQTIPYRLSPNPKAADHYQLSYLPKQKVIREFVKVSPAGFLYRTKLFSSVEDALKYFKANYKEPPPRPAGPGLRRDYDAQPTGPGLRRDYDAQPTGPGLRRDYNAQPTVPPGMPPGMGGLGGMGGMGGMGGVPPGMPPGMGGMGGMGGAMPAQMSAGMGMPLQQIPPGLPPGMGQLLPPPPQPAGYAYSGAMGGMMGGGYGGGGYGGGGGFFGGGR